MADALLIFVIILLAIAGGFAIYYSSQAARIADRKRLRAARRKALADIGASDEYIEKVNAAETTEEIERLAEEREDQLCSGSYSASSA
jgi:uncharacterized membrane protein (DUF106 family)